MLRAARERAALKNAERNPASWGIDLDMKELAANDDVEIVRGAGGRVVRGRRSGAFEILWRSGGLNDPQYSASQRYWTDWCAAAGVIERDTLRLEVIDNGGSTDGVSQGMIDGGKRLAVAHKHIGRASAHLLAALVEPLVMRGEVRVWRVLVQHATGETERHAQAGVVRLALEDLRLAYEEIDKDNARRRARERPQATA